VNANEHATRLPGTSTNTNGNTEKYGTSGFEPPHVDQPDRFGFGSDPLDQNPIDVINERAGLGFNPQRDLRGQPGDDASLTPVIAKDTGQRSGRPAEAPSPERVFVNQQIDQARKEGRQEDVEGWQRIRNMLKNPNPDAPDNSGGDSTLVNNLGSTRRIRSPFVDPVNEQQFGPSGVMKGRDQATDPNPETDPNTGAAMKLIRSTSDAVTDPIPALNAALRTGTMIRG
jgi:hypothetical protein